MITIEIKNDGISAGLQRALDALTNTQPLMNQLGEYLVESTKQRFPTGRAPDGSVWAPKSPVTLERYRRNGDKADGRPLFGPSSALSNNISAQAGPDVVEWGSDRVYAAVQQFGAAQGAFGRTSRNGPIPWGNIPARPFLGLSAEDEVAVLDIIADYVATAAAEPRA